MSDGRTAEARLERLLHVLPAARRGGGASLTELAEALGTTPARILEDLAEVTARAYYQPGGWPDDVVILNEGDRVQVRHATAFERPARLSRDETLCLALALRGAPAAARVADDGARAALLRRAEAHVGRPLADPDPPGSIDAPERAPDPEGIRETLMTSARDRRPCAIWYVKPGAADASVRVVHPYAIAYAEGVWYAVSHCTVEAGIRVFRMDRVLAADVADGRFEVPSAFRVDDYLHGGRVHDGAAGLTVRVRYSRRIARWLRERMRWEPDRIEDDADGSIVVHHRVSDPHWAVAHALTYGAEAEVVEPEDVRALVRDAVRGLVG